MINCTGIMKMSVKLTISKSWMMKFNMIILCLILYQSTAGMLNILLNIVKLTAIGAAAAFELREIIIISLIIIKMNQQQNNMNEE